MKKRNAKLAKLKLSVLGSKNKVSRLIIKHFQKINLNSKASQKRYNKEARLLIEQHKDFLYRNQEYLESFSFMELSLYSFDKRNFNMKKFNSILAIRDFQLEIVSVMNGTDDIEEFKESGSVRQSSPPDEAYDMKGVSELEITPSLISYSLLFDKV